MKTNNRSKVGITFLLFLFFLLQANVYLKSQTNDQSLTLAKKMLHFVQENNLDSVIHLFDKRLVEQVGTYEIKTWMEKGKNIMDKSTFPNDSKIKINKSFSLSTFSYDVQHTVDNYNFPFVSKENKDSVKHFVISVLDNKTINRFYISDYQWAVKVVEPNEAEDEKLVTQLSNFLEAVEKEYSKPHQEKFDVQYDNLKMFNIWYNNGYKKDKKIKGKRQYVVSGISLSSANDSMGFFKKIFEVAASYESKTSKKEQLEKEYAKAEKKALMANRVMEDENMKKLFQDVFDLINTAQIDSIDSIYDKDKEIGNPEILELTFSFKDGEYKGFGVWQIRSILSEKYNKKKNISSDYIIISHSIKTRYLLLKSKNLELVDALKRVADYDYGDYYDDPSRFPTFSDYYR